MRVLRAEQVSKSGTITYLFHDQIGNTRLLVSTTGANIGSYNYGPYGAPTHSGTTTTPLQYAGQYTESESGLVYMRARFYDPATAQFLSVDPLKAVTGEPYSYAHDNPLNYTDPRGLAWQICLGGGASLFGVTVEANACYVSTPGRAGVTGSVGASRGPGFGVNVHAGAGGSNAQTPGESGGPFGTIGASAEGPFGGYVNGFAGKGTGCNPVVVGGTAGLLAGVGAEAGVGGSYTEVLTLP